MPLTAGCRAGAGRQSHHSGSRCGRFGRVGVEVVRVEPGSAAFRAGLEAGDVITRFGEVEAPSAAQVSGVFAAAPDDRPVLAGVTRGDAHLVVALERVALKMPHRAGGLRWACRRRRAPD